MFPMGNMRRNDQREKCRMKQGRTRFHAPAAFPITRATRARRAKWTITKTKRQETKHNCTSETGVNIVWFTAVLPRCCSLMKPPSLEDLLSEQKELLDIASTASRVPVSQKHQAKGSQAQHIFKASSFISRWLSKGFRGGRHLWRVFGQVSPALP